MAETGTVKAWYDGKGFGFIVRQGVAGDIFVHHTEIQMDGRRSLNPGQLVTFRLETRGKGLAASDVRPVPGDSSERCHACGQELLR